MYTCVFVCVCVTQAHALLYQHHTHTHTCVFPCVFLCVFLYVCGIGDQRACTRTGESFFSYRSSRYLLRPSSLLPLLLPRPSLGLQRRHGRAWACTRTGDSARAAGMRHCPRSRGIYAAPPSTPTRWRCPSRTRAPEARARNQGVRVRARPSAPAPHSAQYIYEPQRARWGSYVYVIYTSPRCPRRTAHARGILSYEPQRLLYIRAPARPLRTAHRAPGS